MVKNYSAFHEKVALKYQLYNALFLSLPFERVRNAGILLPLFADFVTEGLEAGRSPAELVEEFFAEGSHLPEGATKTDLLFRFLQLAERQVVLFDALEDAAFPSIQDVDGAGSLKDTINQVIRGNKTEEYRRMLRDYRVRVVLTAHPTQFYPDDVLGIISDLAGALEADHLQSIYELLLQMGKTRFKNKAKPTPLDEARSLLWFIEHVFYETVPRIQHKALAPFLEDPRERVHHPPIVELGFWPGGDRDGNPFVTADLTLEIGNLLRATVLRLYKKDLRELRRRLTFPGILESLDRVAERLSETAEPYASAEELLEELCSIQERLHEDHLGLYADRIEELILKVRLFGFHFATMDIRQDSRVHTRVVSQLLAAAGLRGEEEYEALPPEDRLTAVTEALCDLQRVTEARMRLPKGIAWDTLESLRSAEILRKTNGPRGVHRYIISNTRSAANVLEVLLLARVACGQNLILDIVPLFETINDLAGAERIVSTLLNHPLYADHLASRNMVQTIMLGFSDGTKDGGYVTANWEIFLAKRRLTTLCRSRGVRPVFFDGRGGPPARGGGNTHLFYRSLGNEIESTEIQITVQGQTVSSKYGTRELARYNLEQLVSAGIANQLLSGNDNRLSGDDIERLSRLSKASRDCYQELREHPRFLDYLAEMTPLSYYGQTNIASRPTSRDSSGELSLENLRAIPFVGAWSQMKQNVPGYFGLGTGVEALWNRGEGDELQGLYRRSLFFRTLVNNAMQSLRKTYLPLTAFLRDDPKYGEFWETLKEEAGRTETMLRRVSGMDELLAEDPTNRDSIAMREQMIRPVLVVQQYALSVLRNLKDVDDPDAAKRREICEKIVIKSLASSVNASRNAV
ncbi:MAG: phosphoenolpyruvate carboxylase [Spirochaetota bacterium]